MAGNDSLLCTCEWVANCTSCGQEGTYFVRNRLNPRGRRHTSHFVDDNQMKACGQFKRKPRMVPFQVPHSFFSETSDEEEESNPRKGAGGAAGRTVDALCEGMFVVFTGNDEEVRVARLAEFDIGGGDCAVDPVHVFNNLLIRIKNEPRETLSFDQISSVLAPSALWQTDYPANVVTFMTARNNLGSYYTSCAVRMSDQLTSQLKKNHSYKRLRTADSVIHAYLHTNHADSVLDASQQRLAVATAASTSELDPEPEEDGDSDRSAALATSIIAASTPARKPIRRRSGAAKYAKLLSTAPPPATQLPPLPPLPPLPLPLPLPFSVDSVPPSGLWLEQDPVGAVAPMAALEGIAIPSEGLNGSANTITDVASFNSTSTTTTTTITTTITTKGATSDSCPEPVSQSLLTVEQTSEVEQPAEVEAKQQIFYADCSGCGKVAEYKSMPLLPGKVRFKRHNVTVNKCTSYCGEFRRNIRCAWGVVSVAARSTAPIATADGSGRSSSPVSSTSSSSSNDSVGVGAALPPPTSTSRSNKTPLGSKKTRACEYIKHVKSELFRHFSTAHGAALLSQAGSGGTGTGTGAGAGAGAGGDDVLLPGLTCEVCGKFPFKNRQVLAVHMRRVHGPAKTSPAAGPDAGADAGAAVGGPADVSLTEHLPASSTTDADDDVDVDVDMDAVVQEEDVNADDGGGGEAGQLEGTGEGVEVDPCGQLIYPAAHSGKHLKEQREPRSSLQAPLFHEEQHQHIVTVEMSDADESSTTSGVSTKHESTLSLQVFATSAGDSAAVKSEETEYDKIASPPRSGLETNGARAKTATQAPQQTEDCNTSGVITDRVTSHGVVSKKCDYLIINSSSSSSSSREVLDGGSNSADGDMLLSCPASGLWGGKRSRDSYSHVLNGVGDIIGDGDNARDGDGITRPTKVVRRDEPPGSCTGNSDNGSGGDFLERDPAAEECMRS